MAQKNNKDKADKDNWDKADIVSKFFIPLVVAVSVLWWNADRTKSDRSATMIQIAIGVLSKDPETKTLVDPLREWAISVLQNPTSPPVLGDSAADQLRSRGIEWGTNATAMMDAGSVRKIEEILRELEGWTGKPTP